MDGRRPSHPDTSIFTFPISKSHEQDQPQGYHQFQIVSFHQKKQDDKQQKDIPRVDVF